ncbi:MAG: hypothetical protein AB7F75_02655 [Planctomycetota bacterium]
MGILVALAMALSGGRPVEVWIGEQKAQILKAGTPDLGRVIHHAFNTRRLTCDDAALPSDWGQVTGDGAALDPYELADRLLHLAQALSLEVRPADSELGPLLLDGQKQAWILPLGDKGSWVERTKGAPLPPALDEATWTLVLWARVALKERSVGRPGLLATFDATASTPTLARALVARKGESMERAELLKICQQFPGLADLRVEGLRRSLREGQLTDAEAFWMEGRGPIQADLWVQGALLERRRGHQEAFERLLRAALRQDPWHVEALALIREGG